MRTTIGIDDKLLKEAMKVSGIATKRETVQEALELLVRSRKAATAAGAIRGKVDWEGDPDAMRRDKPSPPKE